MPVDALPHAIVVLRSLQISLLLVALVKLQMFFDEQRVLELSTTTSSSSQTSNVNNQLDDSDVGRDSRRSSALESIYTSFRDAYSNATSSTADERSRAGSNHRSAKSVVQPNDGTASIIGTLDAHNNKHNYNNNNTNNDDKMNDNNKHNDTGTDFDVHLHDCSLSLVETPSVNEYVPMDVSSGVVRRRAQGDDALRIDFDGQVQFFSLMRSDADTTERRRRDALCERARARLVWQQRQLSDSGTWSSDIVMAFDELQLELTRPQLVLLQNILDYQLEVLSEVEQLQKPPEQPTDNNVDRQEKSSGVSLSSIALSSSSSSSSSSNSLSSSSSSSSTSSAESLPKTQESVAASRTGGFCVHVNRLVLSLKTSSNDTNISSSNGDTAVGEHDDNDAQLPIAESSSTHLFAVLDIRDFVYCTEDNPQQWQMLCAAGDVVVRDLQPAIEVFEIVARSKRRASTHSNNNHNNKNNNSSNNNHTNNNNNNTASRSLLAEALQHIDAHSHDIASSFEESWSSMMQCVDSDSSIYTLYAHQQHSYVSRIDYIVRNNNQTQHSDST